MFRRVMTVVLFAAALLGTACSRFDLVELGVGEFQGELDAGLVFEPESGLALDIYRPATAGPHPVILFWYGGSWQSGSRQEYRFVGVELARRGFVTVLADYRLYPDVTFPAFVQDAASAVAWVHANISDHGGDPARVVISGHSAGAHIAMMLATDQRFLAAHDLMPAAIRGVIGLAGPYHFTPQTRTLSRVFNGDENFPAMRAGNFVDGDEPPIVMLHGTADGIVNRVNIREMEAALNATGGCYRTRLYPDVGHIGIIGAFTWAYDSEPIVSDFVDFARMLAAGSLCASQS